jgi:DNA polymerase
MDRKTTKRSRARLALKADKAFGLDAVPLRRKAAPAGDSPAEATRKASPAPPGQPASRANSGVRPAPAPRPASAPPTPQRTPSATRGPGVPDDPGANRDLFGGAAPDRPVLRRPSGALVVAAPGSVLDGPGLPTADKLRILNDLDASQVRGCTRCRLCESRTQTVFGEGDVDAPILFIGEGPGENEDLTGRPFVGRAGELLDKMIAGMGLRREQVFIANIVKCRPPNNRAPLPDETATCTPYLETQIQTIRPRVIVTLGAPAAKYILRDEKLSITRIRGTWHAYRGIKVMPTFHPAYILRQYTPEVRGKVWGDLQMVMRELGLPSRGSPN